mgnify:CR=1 FL=1
MLWTKAVLGTDVYHIIQWFLIYSILGWVVESIYMSICNRKLTNRGFVRGPICPIYGVGALTVYFLLRPVDHNLYLLYLMGCIIPTLLEYGTALLMLKIFGEVWWDYSQKPFNYKGILCLESTLAWGVLALFIFGVFNRYVEGAVKMLDVRVAYAAGTIIVITYLIDFTWQFAHQIAGENNDGVLKGFLRR